jgi:DHA3 family tetracycline resistance protein-like MFS transporter
VRLEAKTVFYGLEVGTRIPTWVVMAVYLVRELHLSPLELVLMGTVMEAAVFLFEIPTGVVADTYSRRLSLIIGYLGMGATWLAVGLVFAPWAVILLWGGWGFAYTFTSGAYQAWIADEVGPENLRALFLRGRRIGYAGSVGGLVLQVLVGTFSLRAGVIVGGAATMLCGLACIVFMPETGFRRATRTARASAFAELRTTAARGMRFAWTAPVILLLVGVELFMGMSSEAFDRLKEAQFLREIGLPAIGDLDAVVWFGIFWLVGMVIGFFVLRPLIHAVEQRGRGIVSRFLFCFALVELVSMLAFALSNSAWPAIAALLGVFFARDLQGPLYATWINEQITDSSVRATVLSISGQANAIGQVGGGPALGAIGNAWGIRAAPVGGAAAIAPALALYGRAIRNYGRDPDLVELPQAVEAGA